MKLIVFGATGGIGSQVVKQGLDAGHEITAVARHPSAITLQHECLNVVEGDVLEPDTVREVLAGQDVVISALGVRNLAPTKLYSEGVKNIMHAMQALDVQRMFCISASGLEPGPLWERLIAKPLLWFILKNMYTDLVRMETMVKMSGLDWTILRPPLLTNGPRTGRYQVAINQQLSRNFSIARADVADYMINHLDDKETYGSIVELAY